MLTGGDSILDMDGLREGAVGKVLPGVQAPSRLGTFLRAFTFGHVGQLGAVAVRFLWKFFGAHRSVTAAAVLVSGAE